MAKPGAGWRFDAAALAFIAAGDFEIRRRDVSSALQGSLDIAIMLELAIYGAVAAWLFLQLTPGQFRRQTLLGAVWIHAATMAVSGVWAPSPMLGAVRGFQLVATVLLVQAIAMRYTRRDLHRLADRYCAMVTMWIVLGLVVIHPQSNAVTGRFSWYYTHPVTAGSLLLISVIYLVHQSAPRSATYRAWPLGVYRLLLVVHVGALLATKTRGSVIAVVFGLLCWAALRVPKQQRGVAIKVGLAAIPPIVAIAAASVRSYLLRGEGAENLTNLNSRLDLWTEAWNAFVERPVFGHGYFSSRELFLETIGLGGAHNAYIEVIVSAGMVGVLAASLLLFIWLRQLRQLSHMPDRALLVGLLAAMAANGFSAQYVMQSGTGSNVWFLLLAAWTVVALREQRHVVAAANENQIEPTSPGQIGAAT